MVSFLIGFLILLARYLTKKNYGVTLSYIFSLLIILLVVGYYIDSYLNYNFFEYLQEYNLGKIQQLGGEERSSQTALMFVQILNNPWGIGFSNIGIERSQRGGFQYEVLILATILRFGIITFTLISFSLIPVFRNIFSFSKLDIYKKFYLTGFLSIIIFSFTNPYLESFSFQWMFFCPLIFLSDFSETFFKRNTSKEQLVILGVL